MYSREKKFRQENDKPKKSHRNTPSFSSSLLDEICRSIDGKPDPKSPDAARFSRASLVEKWMENDKTVFRRRENTVFTDNDPFIFSSTSTSSDSSAGISSSDTELYANRPKPVRTRGVGREKDCYLFDEYEEHERNRAGDDLIKSKSRAMKIYANLKKMKQPISPGARLTSFINSIFTGLNRKKTRDSDRKSTAPSSAKMIARSTTKSAEKMGNGIERAARFDLARVAVDRDAMRCGHRSAGDGRPPLPPNAFQTRRKWELDKSRYERDDEEENDEDAISESSSDLFELDHSSMFGSKDRFCQELPVYETTYFDNNCRLFR